MQKHIPHLIGALVLVGISFSGGMWYERQRVTRDPSEQRREAFMQFGDAGSPRGGMRGTGGVVSGTILSLTEEAMTIQLRDGGSRIVFLGNATAITKMANAERRDLASGVTVFVTGKANADGSITAESVQLRSL